MYWVDYGRALSRLRGRRDDAALALRRAEVISPNYLHRDPHARDTLGELLVRARWAGNCEEWPPGPGCRAMALR